MTLEAQNITFRYPRRGAAPVLEGVNFTLNSGERVGLSAPSGRGKTTLCRLLAGWERPDSGQVLLNGAPVSQWRGFCPVQLLWQNPEEAADPLLRLGTTLREAGPVDQRMMEKLGIRSRWLERYPMELSGGELQRICVARALGPKLRFLLCDEASAMLDVITQAQLWRFLLDQAEKRSLGLLIVSHRNFEKHIITLEDPLEFLHQHKKSIVSQREISVDTESYVTALRASLRQSPDVILLGEMRDYETIQVAMTAAETGHLIFSTLHTIGSANTIDRIIDVFPPSQQRQIAVQLSMVLQAVVSQQLVPSVHGTMVPAFELMTVTPAIRNMIRDNKIPQIDGIIYSSSNQDMFSMDTCLARLCQEGTITRDTALSYATNPDMLSKKLR